MQDPRLAVVYSPREWANRVVRHVTDHGGGLVRLRVVDGRVALEEEFDILIAEDVTSFLNLRFVQELQKRGRRVLGVFDPDEPTGKERLLDLGADDVIAADAPAEEFVRRIQALGPAGPAGLSRVDEALLEFGLMAPEPGARRPDRPRGCLWVVGGPPGGCGASEVAVELARALRITAGTSILVDADERAPSLAQRLGLPPIPNIRTALDALFHGAGQLGAAVQRVEAGGFELLAGLANPADWAQLRPNEVADVIAELLAVRDHVVVNVSPYLEDLARAGSPDRFGVTRALLAGADQVVGVGAASPVGVARMVAWIAEVAMLAPGRPVHVVVNRAPASGFVRSEVTAELLRNFPLASLHFAPVDPAVEKAAWRGELVALGPFTKAVGGLALLAPTSPAAAGSAGAPRRRGRGRGRRSA